MTIHPIYGSNGMIDTFKLKYFLKILVVIGSNVIFMFSTIIA